MTPNRYSERQITQDRDIYVFVLLCFVFCALLLILSVLLVIMGGQHNRLLLSGSQPILYIYSWQINMSMLMLLCLLTKPTVLVALLMFTTCSAAGLD